MTGIPRQCSRTACQQAAVATLTYVYADSTAVVGPLAQHAEPHCYDLCADHAMNLTVPRGWEVVHLASEYAVPKVAAEDIGALADAVADKPSDLARTHRDEASAGAPSKPPSLRVISNKDRD